jgi:hypothetical protein
MRTFVGVLVVVLLVIFLGGAVNLGGAPIFGHIDNVLGISLFMPIHYYTFWLLYRGEGSLRSGLGRTDSEIREFQRAPAGIDNQQKYRQLDDARKDF